MKCGKKVFVVVVDKTQPNWQFCNFYAGLKAAGCSCKNYVFDPVCVDPTTKCWDKCVFKKINSATEKYGCKPYLVSGLYDADLELKLTQFALLVCKILLATTVEDIASLPNMELLPAASDCSKFTSANYRNNNKYGRVLTWNPGAPGTSFYDKATTTNLIANNETTLKECAFCEEACCNKIKTGDIFLSFSEKCNCIQIFDAHPSVSDAALYTLLIKYPDLLKINYSLNRIELKSDASKYVNLDGCDEHPCVYKVITAAGVDVRPDNTLEANQLKVLGSRLCYWLKCKC